MTRDPKYTPIPSMLSVRPLAKSPLDRIPGQAPPDAAPYNVKDTAPDMLTELDELLPPVSRKNRADLEQGLDELQERSLDILYRLLAEAGIDLQERMVIAVDADGGLHVGEHPQAQAISFILADNPHVADNLRIMAALALALRGSDDFALARSLFQGERTGTQLLFQACLKSGLSHFHLLARPQ